MDIPKQLAAAARSRLAAVWDWDGGERFGDGRCRIDRGWGNRGPAASPIAVLMSPKDYELPDYSVVERMEDPQKDLEYEMACAHRDLACLERGFCNIPSIWPYMGVGVVASAFGCETVLMPDKDPWARPLTEDPRGVYALAMPDLSGAPSGLAARVLERIDFFSAATRGTVPIRLTDLQSPLDTAIQILKYEELLIGMYTEPDAVHHLLSMVTDATIQFIQAQAARIENLFGYTHVPLWRPRGLYISDDVTAVLSPDNYRQFARPYNTRLSRQFGGLSMHCCGRYEQNLEAIAEIEGFMSFDADSNDNSVDAIGRALAPRAGVWVAWAGTRQEALDKVRAADDWGFGLILCLQPDTARDGMEIAEEIERSRRSHKPE